MTNDIFSIAKLLMTPGRGILAADESQSSANEKRLALIGLEGTAENRLLFRDLFLTAPGIEDYISGVILHEETLFQVCSTGETFPEHLLSRGILAGIKVDQGLEKISPENEEDITKGINDLSDRLLNYKNQKASFAKWRAVVKIDKEKNLPSEKAINLNCELLAKYAKKCQEMNIVPMVEPEVLMDGNHGLKDSANAIKRTLVALFDAMKKHSVNIEGLILKTSMAHPGIDSEEIVTPKEIANQTAEVLSSVVPLNIGGVVFLSGGQSSKEAIKNLDALADLEPLPFEIAFSYARAIQIPVLEAWNGLEANKNEAQQVLLNVLRDLSMADKGNYV